MPLIFSSQRLKAAMIQSPADRIKDEGFAVEIICYPESYHVKPRNSKLNRYAVLYLNQHNKTTWGVRLHKSDDSGYDAYGFHGGKFLGAGWPSAYVALKAAAFWVAHGNIATAQHAQ